MLLSYQGLYWSNKRNWETKWDWYWRGCIWRHCCCMRQVVFWSPSQCCFINFSNITGFSWQYKFMVYLATAQISIIFQYSYFSGGSIAGLALGSYLSKLKAKVCALPIYCSSLCSFIDANYYSCWWQVHAFSVCDDPDYFYNYVQGLIDGLEAGTSSREIVNILDVNGRVS